MNTDPIIVEISKLNLNGGDYLVLKFPETTNKSDVEHVQISIKENFPELASRVMLLWGDIEIYVMEVKDK